MSDEQTTEQMPVTEVHAEEVPTEVEKAKPDWKQICEESNGTRVMLPEELKEKAKAFIAKHEEMIKKANEWDKLNADFGNEAQNFWHEVRTILHDQGMTDAFSKQTLGWDKDAQADGELVLNIVEQR